MDIKYTNSISVEEYNKIRSARGWTQINPEQVKTGLERRDLIINAKIGNESIGMACLLWDGGTFALIKDIIVIPEYRMKGIEKEMVKQIIDFLQNKLKPGFRVQIDVNAFEDEQFFAEIGFQQSTKENRGIPMHLCLNNCLE